MMNERCQALAYAHWASTTRRVLLVSTLTPQPDISIKLSYRGIGHELSCQPWS